MISLNTIIEGGDGNTTELIDTTADDKAIDLSDWLDARTFLEGYRILASSQAGFWLLLP